MNNEQRERIIEIIEKACTVEIDHDAEILNIDNADEVADALIAAGVIFPKFKVGQTVWVNERNFPSTYFFPHKCFVVGFSENSTCVNIDGKFSNVFNNMVYATELEAREALGRQ